MRARRALAALLGAGLLVAALQAPAAAREAVTTRVVVVTDAGVGLDDPWALAQLALAPGVALAGVLTTHAPALAYPGPKTAARHVRAVLQAVGRADVPVVPGLVEPFGDEQDIKPGAAAEFLIEASRAHDRGNPLRVLVLGAATDVALALVVEPALADRIEIVASGFEAWPKGGDAANVKQDPLAWRLLLQSRAPLVVADAAVARRDLMVPRAQARAIAAGRGRAGAYLAGLVDARPHGEAVSLRDVAPVAWLLGQAEAEPRPRPLVGQDLVLAHGAKLQGPPVRWITRVDGAPLWRALEADLDRRAAAER